MEPTEMFPVQPLCFGNSRFFPTNLWIQAWQTSLPDRVPWRSRQDSKACQCNASVTGWLWSAIWLGVPKIIQGAWWDSIECMVSWPIQRHSHTMLMLRFFRSRRPGEICNISWIKWEGRRKRGLIQSIKRPATNLLRKPWKQSWIQQNDPQSTLQLHHRDRLIIDYLPRMWFKGNQIEGHGHASPAPIPQARVVLWLPYPVAS